MRTRGRTFAVTVALACCTLQLVQAQTPLRQSTIAEALDSWITNTEWHAVPAANAMPEAKYGFAPGVAIGEFKGVRTFAEQVKHLAADNYWMAALILGKKPSAEMTDETGPDSVRTKAEIIAYLKGSFAALHQAVMSIDDRNVVAPVDNGASWQKTRLSFAVDAVAHSFDHYGQMVEYLRMNGIVPPGRVPGPR